MHVALWFIYQAYRQLGFSEHTACHWWSAGIKAEFQEQPGSLALVQAPNQDCIIMYIC